MFMPCFNFNLCLDSYFLYAQESQQRWISSPVQWPNKGFLISDIFLMRVFSLQLLFPAFFLSFLSPCALLRCSLFSCLVMYFFLSLFHLHTPSVHHQISFTSTWTSISLGLLLPFSGCNVYMYVYLPQSDSSWK